MNNKDIDRILNGEATEAQREDFFARVACDELLREEYAKKKSERVFASLPNMPEMSKAMPSFSKKISLPTLLTHIAAILFIPLCGYFIYEQIAARSGLTEYETISSTEPVGEITYRVDRGVKGHIVLPDSTEVWLNSDSRLTLPPKFDQQSRIVSLSGEGYFIVKSDNQHPFYIKTPQEVLVKVTGTEFNLNCYQERADIHLSLVSGKVQLLQESTDEVIVVQPNEETIVGKSHMVMESSDKQIGDKSVWKDGLLKFDNTPMDEMIMRMERWYGVHITVDDKDIYKAVFTATFSSESIIQVLDLLEFTSGIKYSIDGNNVVLSKK